jgi:hypothetical protein
MCAVSMVSDYYTRTIPTTFPPPRTWDDETKEMMRKIIELLDKVDKRLGDRECLDNQKQKFFEDIGYVTKESNHE